MDMTVLQPMKSFDDKQSPIKPQMISLNMDDDDVEEQGRVDEVQQQSPPPQQQIANPFDSPNMEPQTTANPFDDDDDDVVAGDGWNDGSDDDDIDGW